MPAGVLARVMSLFASAATRPTLHVSENPHTAQSPRWPQATAQMEQMKGKKSSVSGVLTGIEAKTEAEDEAKEAAAHKEPIHKIVFACDAGMGSSAMGASVLRNKVKKAGFKDITVVNVAIANPTPSLNHHTSR